MKPDKKQKVVFCTLFLGEKPTQPFIDSLAACLPAVEEAGFEHGYVQEANCPYISAARSKVLRKALDAEADIIVYLDYDVSWRPEDMVKLLTTEGDVVAGTYRKKSEEVVYMGTLITDQEGFPIVREDGAIKANFVPAGFLKVTRVAVNCFARTYPELMFGEVLHPDLDLFNHGVIDGVWFGEDYAFSKRWTEKCGDIWLIPDVNIDHHRGSECYKGNFHEYLKGVK